MCDSKLFELYQVNYVFQVKANKNIINFTANFDYFINSCGGVREGQKIEITSPNYPNNYQQNTNCAWLIKLPEDENVNVSIKTVE